MAFQFVDEVVISNNSTAVVQFAELPDEAEILEIRFNVKVDSNYTYGDFYGATNNEMNNNWSNATYHLTGSQYPGNPYTNTGYGAHGSGAFITSTSYSRVVSGDGGGSDTMANNFSPGYIRIFNWNNNTRPPGMYRFSASLHDDGSSYYNNVGFGWDYGCLTDIYPENSYDTSDAYEKTDSIELKVYNFSGGTNWCSGSRFALYGWTVE